MRNLTVKRDRSFVASLVKNQVWIEDPASSELTINGVPCRKLGDLKNGEEKTFLIGENAAKVFVIVDKTSKDFCNDFMEIPEGTEDVTLKGAHVFNPGVGNAFRFDGSTNAAVVKSKRTKATVIGVAVMVALIVAGTITGSLIAKGGLPWGKAAAKDFTSHGLTMTLTKDFTEDRVVGQTVCFRAKDVLVLGYQEAFSLMAGLEDYTLEEYGKLMLQANGLDPSTLTTFDGIPGFEYDYTDPSSSDTYHYRDFILKSADSFWTMQFATFKDSFSKYEAQIGEWVKSVRFAQ